MTNMRELLEKKSYDLTKEEYRKVLHFKRTMRKKLYDIVDGSTINEMNKEIEKLSYRERVELVLKLDEERRATGISMTEEEFLDFMNSWKWTFAKSYAKTSPHEYIVCKVNQKRRKDFEKAVQLIRDNGELERYFRKIFTVYKINGHKYWTMGDPMDTTWLINRSLHGEEDRTYGS